MLNDMLRSVSKIYIAYGVTDFRKQINSLCSIVKKEYHMNPYNRSAFIFCNRKKTSIKILCYDKNGFILAQKTLINVDNMKFKWPKNEYDLKQITKEQLMWLLSGLDIYTFKTIDLNDTNVAI